MNEQKIFIYRGTYSIYVKNLLLKCLLFRSLDSIDSRSPRTKFNISFYSKVFEDLRIVLSFLHYP
ncbi:hypothetical protein BpHYR1_045737 [Brachionus plicatilis]|uniref:Uncharacterized protein n=1 Tax=Brachionus plicatilis TaxID=10195 RepID=A0A3M7PXM0_BRAPC|nr:hypothetical protein BpHYR1_045737 [Brachionus plicatilis]